MEHENILLQRIGLDRKAVKTSNHRDHRKDRNHKEEHYITIYFSFGVENL